MALNVVSNAGPLMVFSKLNVLHLQLGSIGVGPRELIDI